MTDKPTLKDIKEAKDLLCKNEAPDECVNTEELKDYGLDASHYPHPKPKNEMPKEIWASLRTTMAIVDGVFYEDEVEGFTEKYHHDSEIQKRDEIIRYLMITIQDIGSECVMEMSRANHKEKLAQMDGHTSEVNHQEGRWHQANDLLEYVQKAIIDVKHADVIKEICDDK